MPMEGGVPHSHWSGREGLVPLERDGGPLPLFLLLSLLFSLLLRLLVIVILLVLSLPLKDEGPIAIRGWGVLYPLQWEGRPSAIGEGWWPIAIGEGW